MKLLLDQNLSYRLITPLSDYYPETAQVARLGLSEADDKTIWEYARAEGYSIVTQDADFYEYSILAQGPPLIVWLKHGDQPRQVVLEKLINEREAIAAAQANPAIWCIEIY